MLSEFLKIVADNTDSYTVDDIKMDSDFYEDLEMNSMDIINMTIDIESAFKIKIKEKSFKDIHTVGDLKNHIEKLMKTELV